MMTIYRLQITSDYNIVASPSATSATLDYKSTTRTHYHNISASNYIQLQYFSFTFIHLSNCQLQVDYKNTLSQYNSFKLHFNKALTILNVLVCGWDFRNFTHMVPQQYCNGTLTCYPETSHQWTFQLCMQISAMFLWHMYRHHCE